MLTGSRSKSIADTIITFARSADAARSIRKAITVRTAEGRCRKENRMCNYNCKPIEPKDETWWEDMDRDAQEYLASCDQEEEND
jgi:hypothetical protein